MFRRFGFRWSRGPLRQARGCPAAAAAAEGLERRVLLTAFWEGDVSDLWSDENNWAGGVTPAEDAVVVFPANASRKTSTNDLGELDLLKVTIQGSGYTVGSAGGTNVITFTGDGLVTENVPAGGTNTWNAALDTATDTTFVIVAFDSTLVFGGPLGGSSGGTVAKAGQGTLEMTAANPDFLGSFQLNDGTLRVDDAEALGPAGGSDGDTFATNLTTIELAAGADGGDEVLHVGDGVLQADATLAWDGQIDLNNPERIIVPAGVVLTLNDELGGDSIDKEGDGTLALAGGYSIGSGSTVEDGVLSFRSDGSTGAITVDSGAAVNLQGGADVNASGTLSLNGAGSGSGALLNVSGTNSWDGTVQAVTNTTIGSSAGTLTIDGTLNTGSPTGRVVTFDGAGNTTVDGAVTGNGSVVKNGGGTLVFAGTALNTYPGNTTVNAGVLNIRKASALGGTTNGTTVDAGAVLQLQGSISVGAESLRIEGAGPGGAGALLNVSGTNTWGGPVTLNNAAATIGSTSGRLTINGAVDNDGFLLTVAGEGDVDLNGVVSDTGGLTKTGNGTLTLDAANTYGGATNIDDGAIELEDPSGLGGTASGTTVASGAALRLAGAGAVGAERLTLNGTGVAADGALLNVSGANTWAGDVVLSTASRIGVDGGSLTISGRVTGAGGLTKVGPQALTLSGPNDYTGATTVSAGQLVARGSSALGATGAGSSTTVGTTARLTFGPPAAGNANVTFNEGLVLNGTLDALSNGAFTSTWAGPVLLNGAPTLTASATTPYTISGQVSGNGGPVKEGVGTVILGGTADNVWLGVTRVNAGVLALNKTVGQDAVSTANLIIGRADHTGGATVLLLADNQIPDTAAVTINGTGLLDLDGRSDTVGPVTLAGGDIATGTGLLTLDGNVTAHSVTISPPPNVVVNDPVITGRVALGSAAGRVFDVGPATGLSGSTLRIEATVSGAGGLTKNGIQTLVLAGTADNTYAGTTQVNAGTLVLAKSNGRNAVGPTLVVGDNVLNGTALPIDVVRWDNDNQVPDGAVVTVNASGVLRLNNNNETIGPVTLHGSLVETGTGLLTLNGTLTARASDEGPDPARPARITGRLDLGPASAFTGRDFEVQNGPGDLDLVVSAPVSGGVDLNKRGTGGLELAGANTHTGRTGVFGGELFVTGSTGDVRAQLSDVGGHGTVGALTAITLGAVTPGTLTDTTGRITAAGNVSFGDDSRFEVDLAGVGAGNSYDQLRVGNLAAVNLGDADGSPEQVNLVVRLAAGFDPVAGNVFRIIDQFGAQPVAGEFFQRPEGSTFTVGTETFRISYRGGDGNDVTLTVPGGPAANLPPNTPALTDSPDPVAAPNPLTLSAFGVSDPDAGDTIASVAFFRESNGIDGLQVGTGGDTPLGTDTSSTGGYNVTVNTTGLPGGTYTYYARSTDNHGANSNPAQTTNTVQGSTNEPPRVTGVFVNSTGWTTAFRNHLQSTGRGEAAFGFAVAGGAEQLNELPWTNLNQIAVRFSENVVVQQNDLQVRGVNRATYAINNFVYDNVSFTATWTLAGAVANDKLLIDLDGDAAAGVADGLNLLMDGEWTGVADTFPSGDGTAGGDFRFQLNVLPGDVDRSGGGVNSADVVQTRNRQLTSTTVLGTAPNTYSVFHDVNGSGGINSQDVILVRNRQLRRLPAANPASAGLITPETTDRRRSTRMENRE